MALQWVETDLQLSLDDFIPPHLQRKSKSSNNYTEDHQVISDNEDHMYKATLVLTSEDTWDSPSPRTQRRWIRYDGIGPTDEDGLPFASRSSVDKPREWYKNMFRILHPLSDAEDSDSEGSIQAEDGSRTHHVKKVSSRYLNKDPQNEPDQDEQSRRSKETSHLHIKLKPTVSESPSKISGTSNVQTSVAPSSTLLHTTGYSHLLLNKPSEEQRSPPSRSEESQFTRCSTGTYSSTFSTSKQPQQTQANANQKQTPEPTLPNSDSSRPSYTSRVSDFPHTQSPLTNRETTSLKSPTEKIKYFTLGVNSSARSSLSPTSSDRMKSSKVLDQLETELREFTEELDRDLQARKRTESLELCEEVILRRSSYREDGRAESNLNSTQNSAAQNFRSDTEDNQALSPVAQAIVKFDFVADSEKEISLQRGTTVHILKQIDKNWLLVEQKGRRGLFPESYVKVISPDQHDGADTPQLSAIALYDFKADSDVELPLRKGQLVSITRRVDGRWFEGRVEGSPRLGLFPANYVQIKDWPLKKKKEIPQVKAMKSTKPIVQVSDGVTLREKPCVVKVPASNKLQQLQGTMYRAVFPFSPNNSDELQLLAGDVVTVTQQCEDGWYVGVCWRTHQFGTFPGNYVVPYVTS
ncbi:vinexin isoform X2 [Aquarana catesbeiana]|uniref:vinexin isoform X2 n=1 Tax=Aquarana catesbeiana TaxID=8400 RepID=UPI003CC9FD83